MSLFGKKKETASCCCASANQPAPAGSAASGSLRVEVLGSGCAKFNQLEANTRTALAQLGIDAQIGHVTDFAQIAAYGVMTTPALVVDGKVVCYGKVLKKEEVKALIRKVRG